MKLKTFRAETMADALRKVKQEFGSDAVILNTRTLTKGRMLGLRGQACVEITAAPELESLPPAIKGRKTAGRSRETGQAEGAATRVSPAVANLRRPSSDAVLAEVRNLRESVSQLVHETRRSTQPELPESLYDSYQCLVQNEVAEQIARDLVTRVRRDLSEDKLRQPDAVRSALAALMVKMLPTSGPIKCSPKSGPLVIGLIGPTGVGKTTTVAKLAANLSLREGRRVALITIDTYRIAATEQLKTYADIINVPLAVASTPDEYRDAIERFSDFDVILLDTAGRSQRDGDKLGELQEFFRMVRPDEVHLVLSGASSEAVMSQAIERFSPLGIDHVIVTKLDEAVGFGVVLNCLTKASAKLSFVTTGQAVPDDIEVGDGRVLAARMLGCAPSSGNARVG